MISMETLADTWSKITPPDKAIFHWQNTIFLHNHDNCLWLAININPHAAIMKLFFHLLFEMFSNYWCMSVCAVFSAWWKLMKYLCFTYIFMSDYILPDCHQAQRYRGLLPAKFSLHYHTSKRHYFERDIHNFFT